jgi:hypothetical protein
VSHAVPIQDIGLFDYCLRQPKIGYRWPVIFRAFGDIALFQHAVRRQPTLIR